MEIEGFRLENKMESFDIGISCWRSFTGHGAGDAFFSTSLIVCFGGVDRPPDYCVRVSFEVIRVDEACQAQNPYPGNLRWYKPQFHDYRVP